MRFWDASAVVPLLVAEPTTSSVQSALGEDHGMIVWWGTEVECASALARLEREAALTSDDANVAFERLDALLAAWHEIQPTEPVKRMARRIVRVHPLRAADALQLSAALVASDGRPDSMEIVSLDSRLTEAARREGFLVLVPE